MVAPQRELLSRASLVRQLFRVRLRERESRLRGLRFLAIPRNIPLRPLAGGFVRRARASPGLHSARYNGGKLAMRFTYILTALPPLASRLGAVNPVTCLQPARPVKVSLSLIDGK